MKVILAIDDSTYSQEVIEAATNRDWPTDTEFKILTILEPLDYSLSNEFEDVINGIKEKREKAADHFGKSVCEKLKATIHGARVHFEVRTGNPRTEVVDAAVEWCADRIMIGAHGHRSCPHNILGSVSRAVAGYAPCSVEIVRAKNSKVAKPAKDSTRTAKV